MPSIPTLRESAIIEASLENTGKRRLNWTTYNQKRYWNYVLSALLATCTLVIMWIKLCFLITVSIERRDKPVILWYCCLQSVTFVSSKTCFTFSEQCIVMYICKKNQQDVRFFEPCVVIYISNKNQEDASFWFFLHIRKINPPTQSWCDINTS